MSPSRLIYLKYVYFQIFYVSAIKINLILRSILGADWCVSGKATPQKSESNKIGILVIFRKYKVRFLIHR